MRFVQLTLAVAVSVLPLAATAREAPQELTSLADNRLECRPVVLVGAQSSTGLVCKTHKEWLEFDRAGKTAIV